jgi:hypothetical protein
MLRILKLLLVFCTQEILDISIHFRVLELFLYMGSDKLCINAKLRAKELKNSKLTSTGSAGLGSKQQQWWELSNLEYVNFLIKIIKKMFKKLLP